MTETEAYRVIAIACWAYIQHKTSISYVRSSKGSHSISSFSYSGSRLTFSDGGKYVEVDLGSNLLTVTAYGSERNPIEIRVSGNTAIANIMALSKYNISVTTDSSGVTIDGQGKYELS